jgi:hypothetical protein
MVVDRESHLVELARYIVLNPVRAGMVEQAGAWPWSSFRATSNDAPGPSWLAVAWFLSQFGGEECVAIQAYRRFVHEGLRAASPWAELRGQIWLGRAAFREHMQSFIAGKPLHDIPVGQTRPERPLASDILTVVSTAYNRSLELVPDRSCQPAFRAWVYLLRRAANLQLKEVAALAGISGPRVSQIRQEIEQGEREPILDRLFASYKLKI